VRYSGSLGPDFSSWFVIGPNHVKPAFALALFGRFLTYLSRPLGALVTFSRAWRPTQTAHLPVSIRRCKWYEFKRAVFHRRLGTDLAVSPGSVSRLRYTFELISQRQVAVKLHGVFAFSWKLTDCAPSCRFHRPRRGDSRALVGPSCKSPIKRQGITLTSVTFETSDLSEADHDFS